MAILVRTAMRNPVLLALVLALAAGCGQKGPLYLRDQPPPGVKPEKLEAYKPVPYPQEREGEKKP
jgi:predicted small lipoprotein YifL